MSISSCKAQYTGQSPKPAGVAPGGSKGGPAMSGMQVNSASAASRQAQSAAPAAEKDPLDDLADSFGGLDNITFQ